MGEGVCTISKFVSRGCGSGGKRAFISSPIVEARRLPVLYHIYLNIRSFRPKCHVAQTPSHCVPSYFVTAPVVETEPS
jgi:hypothetical protein